ncbi:hypothetical protein RF11_15803 [Thelohanellus kitauei]|uniref:Uncharacterized protein n=1 Tax=Thelohanellus kitauei TaxID=669202 RepID=A0A0C2IKP0_THEKT|nr:hypothetical protein RF11_15803 [Thelohanellus kitauei]
MVPKVGYGSTSPTSIDRWLLTSLHISTITVKSISNQEWNEFSFDPPHAIQLQSGNETRNIYILLKPVNGKGRCALSGVLLLNRILLLPNSVEINHQIQIGCPNASGIPDEQLSGQQPQSFVTLSVDSVENGSKNNSGFDGVTRASHVYRNGSIFLESSVSLTSSSRIDDKTSIFVVWLIINVVIVIVYGYFGLRKRISKMGMKEDPPTDEKTSDKEANC